ncbi:hypothetical protein FALBO_4537 [Fusarium albosuccineum]|uniref:Uncharacterized protein n=1 Tax=Fusarium albosuccineum TaxID=1237068 RepID=A0A8H4LJD5_9HYPO|nr:hypothetical protein FALBO_4537 [Fusarium albosuccineum]
MAWIGRVGNGKEPRLVGRVVGAAGRRASLEREMNRWGEMEREKAQQSARAREGASSEVTATSVAQQTAPGERARYANSGEQGGLGGGYERKPASEGEFFVSVSSGSGSGEQERSQNAQR